MLKLQKEGIGQVLGVVGGFLKCIQCFFIHTLDFLRKVAIIVKHIEQMGIFQIRNYIFSIYGISLFLFATRFGTLQLYYSSVRVGGKLQKPSRKGKTAPKKGEINYEYNK